jgi:prepilin-type N-terminal cleavage/methylation domain-containing protein
MDLVRRNPRRAFSLVELVIVVVIIGIIGAIAIPRLSRGSAAATDNAVRGNLSVLRRAIELYAAEHDNTFPDTTNIGTQLIQYSDASGTTSATKTTTCIFGPYLKAVPTLPVGARKGGAGIATADGANIGWLYTVTAGLGDIKANTTTETDARGIAYNTY